MKATELERIVLQQGFVFLPHRGKGSHRVYKKGKDFTTIPFHSGEVDPFLVKKILKQVGL